MVSWTHPSFPLCLWQCFVFRAVWLDYMGISNLYRLKETLWPENCSICLFLGMYMDVFFCMYTCFISSSSVLAWESSSSSFPCVSLLIWLRVRLDLDSGFKLWFVPYYRFVVLNFLRLFTFAERSKSCLASRFWHRFCNFFFSASASSSLFIRLFHTCRLKVKAEKIRKPWKCRSLIKVKLFTDQVRPALGSVGCSFSGVHALDHL